jgi:hypothetical protein
MIEITDIVLIKTYTVKYRRHTILVTFNISEEYSSFEILNEDQILVKTITEIFNSEQQILKEITRIVNNLIQNMT